MVKQKKESISFNFQYPNSDLYEYKTYLMRLDLDKVREEDIKNGTGFIITAPKGIKKDIKNQDGIFSERYGSISAEDNSFTSRYRCLCGLKRKALNEGELCPVCRTRVVYKDDNISITGYFVTNDKYHLIHPNLYCTLAQFIGAGRLDRMLKADIEVDSNGNVKPIVVVKKDEPFKGIGMMEFYERFDEIMDFYMNKYSSKPEKRIYYDDIMANKDILFNHTIAVYSSILRPTIIDNGSLKYEECNDHFNMIASLIPRLNDDKLSIDNKPKERLELLYDIQSQLNEVYNKIRDMLAKKKGDIRSAIGGRYCFSSRSVIKQDVNLKADEVKLPFAGLCELMQQIIINILVRSYHFSYADAYKKWYKAQISGYDKVIYDIIQGMIHHKGGLPVLINRNPQLWAVL